MWMRACDLCYHRVWTAEAPVTVSNWRLGGFGGGGTGFGGHPAAAAGTLVEIKQLKIDRHSEKFKDCKV